MAMTWLQQMFTPQGSGRYRWQGRPDQGGGEFTGSIPGVYEGDEQDIVFTEPMQVRSDGSGIKGELMPQAYTAQTGDGNPVGELDKLADRLEGMASGAPFNRGWDANEFSAPGPWGHQLSGMDQLSPTKSTAAFDSFPALLQEDSNPREHNFSGLKYSSSIPKYVDLPSVPVHGPYDIDTPIASPFTQQTEQGLPVGHGQDDDAGMRSVENFNTIRAAIQAEKDRQTRERSAELSIDDIVNSKYGPSEEDIKINSMINDYRPGPWNKTEEEVREDRILAGYYPVQNPGPMGPYMKHSGPEMWRRLGSRGRANYPRRLF